MAAEVSLKIVREILSACNVAGDAETASKVPSMLRVLSQNLNHADRRVRYASVAAFAGMTQNYKDQLEGSKQYVKEFDIARASLAENQNDGDMDHLAMLNRSLESLGFAPAVIAAAVVESNDESDYLDSNFEPNYCDDKIGLPQHRIHGMILRLAPIAKGKKVPVPADINAAVIQMRMVLVAGVVSASLRVESNDAAEEIDDHSNSTVAKLLLSVKVAPSEDEGDEFVNDLSKAILDATDNRFKLANVDFWETHQSKSGKDSPEEKSTEVAESDYANDNDDGMYLDDDEKLSNRVLGKKGEKGAKSRKPWSMFNPSSALGLNSVFNSNELLEMIEYDSEEAVAARRPKEPESPKIADEARPAVTTSRFGLLRRLFG